MRTAIAFAAVAFGVAGCEVATGSTSGYSLVDAGGCISARDCDGGVGAAVCCVTVSTTGASTSCNGAPICPSLPGAAPVQLCLGSAECADDASCTAQKCYWTGKPTVVLACGALPDCVPP
jgi:hypothetical protein